MKKRDKRKRAKRHQIAKDQQIVKEIIETEKLKVGIAELEKLWSAILGGGGRKTGSEN